MTAAWLALLALAGIGTFYVVLASVVAMWVGRRLPASPPDDGASRERAPSVTILKPLHGAEPGLFENLASFASQDYPAPVQIVLGIQNPADSAIAVARQLQAAFPALAVDFVIDGRVHGTNRKVSNLINMAREIRHEVIVLADSDMRVGPGYLRSLIAELSRPGVGAVTCPYDGVALGNVWSELSRLAIDSHFLPGVVLGSSLGLAHPCMGSTIALRRETVERIGGFRVLADELADDHALGAHVRRLGLLVRVAPFTVGHICPERSLSEVAAQELRWQRTVRQVAPGGHLGSIVTHPVAFAAAAFAIGPGQIAAAFVLAAIAARLGLCLAAERAFGLKPHPYWLVPARDLLSFALFVASFFGRRVSWRGHHYDVARSGALIPKTRPPL